MFFATYCVIVAEKRLLWCVFACPAEKNIIFAPLKTPGMAHGRRTTNPLGGICGGY